MGIYLDVIGESLIFFPVVALLITLPYVIYNYRKYGSVMSFRIVIVYSFVLYLMCVYFLVILPLPSVEEVRQMTSPRMQLIPFQFVADICETPNAVFQVLFNVLMTVPFGIYLRYYFRCSLKKTVLISFLLSLFFELTQLSGLYFIYPRSYRLFDVDDLMANTLGGMLGYGVLQPFRRILPSRQRIDQISFARGKRISFSRRLLAFLADMICLNILQGFLRVLPWTMMLLYFVIFPILWKGQTPGMRFMKMRLSLVKGEKLRWYQPIQRYGSLWLLCVGIPVLWSGLVTYGYQKQWISALLASVWQWILWGLFVAGVITALTLMVLQKKLFFEKWSGTELVSTIDEKAEQ